jgi:hypothetical protein
MLRYLSPKVQAVRKQLRITQHLAGKLDRPSKRLGPRTIKPHVNRTVKHFDRVSS